MVGEWVFSPKFSHLSWSINQAEWIGQQIPIAIWPNFKTLIWPNCSWYLLTDPWSIHSVWLTLQDRCVLPFPFSLYIFLFLYICTVHWFHGHLYSKLVLCAHVQIMIWLFQIFKIWKCQRVFSVQILMNISFRYTAFENGRYIY